MQNIQKCRVLFWNPVYLLYIRQMSTDRILCTHFLLKNIVIDYAALRSIKLKHILLLIFLLNPVSYESIISVRYVTVIGYYTFRGANYGYYSQVHFEILRME